MAWADQQRDEGSKATRELRQARADLRQAIADLRTEIKRDLADLRTEIKRDLADLRTEIKRDLADLRMEIKGLKILVVQLSVGVFVSLVLALIGANAVGLIGG